MRLKINAYRNTLVLLWDFLASATWSRRYIWPALPSVYLAEVYLTFYWPMSETLIYLIFLWFFCSTPPQITMSHHFLFLLCLHSQSRLSLTPAKSNFFTSQIINRLLKNKPEPLSHKAVSPQGNTFPVVFIVFVPLSVFLQSHCVPVRCKHCGASLNLKISTPHSEDVWNHTFLSIFIHATEGQLRKLTVGTLHQFEFLSPTGCQIVISSSLSRWEFLTATLLQRCRIELRKWKWQVISDIYYNISCHPQTTTAPF